jgi:hypothetical protein
MEEPDFYFYGSFWPKESLTDDDGNVEKDEEVSDNCSFDSLDLYNCIFQIEIKESFMGSVAGCCSGCGSGDLSTN